MKLYNQGILALSFVITMCVVILTMTLKMDSSGIGRYEYHKEGVNHLMIDTKTGNLYHRAKGDSDGNFIWKLSNKFK